MKIEIVDGGHASITTDSGFEYISPGGASGGSEKLVREALGLSLASVLAFPPYEGEDDGEYAARLARELAGFGLDEGQSERAAVGMLEVAGTLLEHLSDSELKELFASIAVEGQQEDEPSAD